LYRSQLTTIKMSNCDVTTHIMCFFDFEVAKNHENPIFFFFFFFSIQLSTIKMRLHLKKKIKRFPKKMQKNAKKNLKNLRFKKNPKNRIFFFWNFFTKIMEKTFFFDFWSFKIFWPLKKKLFNFKDFQFNIESCGKKKSHIFIVDHWF